MSALSKYLKKYLIDHHITQYELSIYLDVTPAAVTHWISNDVIPTRKNTIKNLCDYFGADIILPLICGSEVYKE